MGGEKKLQLELQMLEHLPDRLWPANYSFICKYNVLLALGGTKPMDQNSKVQDHVKPIHDHHFWQVNAHL